MTKEEILLAWNNYDKFPDFAPILEDLLNERESLKSKLAACEDPIRRYAALSNALTASPDTKGAYIGEFHFEISNDYSDGDESPITQKVTVPWTTTKDIMKAIKKYAEENI